MADKDKTLFDSLRAFLLADKLIAELVADRITRDAAREMARPYLLVTIAGNSRIVKQGGRPLYRAVLVEIAALCEDPGQADALSGAVSSRLLDDESILPADFAAVEAEDEYDAPSTDDAQTLFGVVQTYTVSHYSL